MDSPGSFDPELSCSFPCELRSHNGTLGPVGANQAPSRGSRFATLRSGNANNWAAASRARQARLSVLSRSRFFQQ